MQITFRSHFCNIILSSPCASDSLLRSRSMLAGSKLYDNLFIRPYLDMKDVKVGRLYYHVFKSNLLPGYKSIFNNRSNKYESLKLIILNDKTSIDWKSNDYTPSSDEIITWKNSFSTFRISNKKSNDSVDT